jgi:diacylglycerol O-acyltransferase / wax synthase
MLRRLHAEAPPLAGFADRIESSPRNFALCVSNVPGPHDAVQVLGRPVLSLHSLAEIGKRHGLRVAVVSLGGRLFFGLLADPAIAEDLEAMAAGIEAEAEALGAAAT